MSQSPPEPAPAEPKRKPKTIAPEVIMTEASPELLEWLGLPTSGNPEDSKHTARRFHGGNLPTITPEMLQRIARRQVFGFTLRDALALEPEPITVEHFQRQLEGTANKGCRLQRVYAQKIAMAKLGVLAYMETCGLRTMPSNIWKMERALPGDFAQPKAQNNTNVSVSVSTVALGLEEAIRSRAAQLARKPRKLLPSGNTGGNVKGENVVDVNNNL